MEKKTIVNGYAYLPNNPYFQMTVLKKLSTPVMYSIYLVYYKLQYFRIFSKIYLVIYGITGQKMQPHLGQSHYMQCYQNVFSKN